MVSGGNQYFYPFGGNRGAAFSALTTKRFTGQYHESSLPGGEGLSYYNARWYDAKLGRFLSADSIVPGPGNPQAFNRYAYTFNNPLNLADPSGHEPIHHSNYPCSYTACVKDTTAGKWVPVPTWTTELHRQYYGLATAAKQPPAKVTKKAVDVVATARVLLPVVKALTKKFWSCPLGNCLVSMTNWTGSLDVGAMGAPVLLAARGTASIAVDHEGGIAVVLSAGGGGSTPTLNAGAGATVTNAPSVSKLAGYSVQAGGSIDAGAGIMAEGVFFSDSDTGQKYGGLSVSGVGSFPDPIIASVHGTFEHSWIPAKGNVFDWFFYPLEWILKEK